MKYNWCTGVKVIYHLNVSENISINNHWNLSEWSLKLFLMIFQWLFTLYFDPDPNFQWIFIEISTHNKLSFNEYFHYNLILIKFQLFFIVISCRVWNTLGCLQGPFDLKWAWYIWRIFCPTSFRKLIHFVSRIFCLTVKSRVGNFRQKVL